MVTGSSNPSSTADREIVVSRLLDAPRELVFEAWTKSEHVAQWFGPNGFTTTTQEMDVRPGGTWRFIMHGPDGTDYNNRVVYSVVSPPDRLAYDHDDGEGNFAFKGEVTFEAEGEQKTLVTLRTILSSPEVLKQMIEQVGALEGANQTMDRLAAYVKNL